MVKSAASLKSTALWARSMPLACAAASATVSLAAIFIINLNFMNKKNEIEILSAAVVALGSNSYCATWLAEQIPAIKMAIESDLYPQFRAYSFAESQQNARKMREDALVEADLIIADAKLNAERLTNQARTQVADIKRRAITDLTAL